MTLDELKAKAKAGVAEAKARQAAGLAIKTRRRSTEQAEAERLEADTRGIRKMMHVLDRMGGRAPRSGTVTIGATGNTYSWGKRASDTPRRSLERRPAGKRRSR